MQVIYKSRVRETVGEEKHTYDESTFPRYRRDRHYYHAGPSHRQRWTRPNQASH